MSLKLSIVTPLKKLITDLEVKSVSLPAYKGELTILDHHEPLITTLETGVLSYEDMATSKTVQIAVSWGFVEINKDVISVLAETAVTKKDLDVERAKKSLAEANQTIKTTDSLETVEACQEKIKKEEARLELV